MKNCNGRLSIRIIGETNNRQSKYELQNLLFEIDGYIAIEKENKKE